MPPRFFHFHRPLLFHVISFVISSLHHFHFHLSLSSSSSSTIISFAFPFSTISTWIFFDSHTTLEQNTRRDAWRIIFFHFIDAFITLFFFSLSFFFSRLFHDIASLFSGDEYFFLFFEISPSIISSLLPMMTFISLFSHYRFSFFFPLLSLLHFIFFHWRDYDFCRFRRHFFPPFSSSEYCHFIRMTYRNIVLALNYIIMNSFSTLSFFFIYFFIVLLSLPNTHWISFHRFSLNTSSSLSHAFFRLRASWLSCCWHYICAISCRDITPSSFVTRDLFHLSIFISPYRLLFELPTSFSSSENIIIFQYIFTNFSSFIE